MDFLRTIQALALAIALIWISLVDFDRFEIPDIAALVLFVSGGLSILRMPSFDRWDHILAGIMFAGLLFLVAFLFRILRGHQGLGFGDVKLAGGIGLWVGLNGVVFVLLGAALAALVTLSALSLMRRQSMEELRNSGIAFGPFLCLFTWVVWLEAL